MSVPEPSIFDVTMISTVVACGCGWRSIDLTPDSALLRYHEHRIRTHRTTPQAVAPCPLCGQEDTLLPRLGICRRCHRALRAAKARGVYAAHGRADRRPAS